MCTEPTKEQLAAAGFAFDLSADECERIHAEATAPPSNSPPREPMTLEGAVKAMTMVADAVAGAEHEGKQPAL